MFKVNESSTDRLIRVVVGIIALIAGIFALTGIFKIIALVLGLIALVTGVLGFCGIYAVLGINTNTGKNKSDNSENV